MPTVLYSDEHIAVAIKNAGMLSEGASGDSLPEILKKQLGLENIYTIHRLDRETEGIIVYALTQSAAAVLSADIANENWKKVYTALLWGRPEKEADRLCDMLYYDRKRSKSFVVDRQRKGVKQAILDYKIIGTPDEKRTAVRVELQTGRTHQIRVQFASRGFPLCGDRRYGAPKESGKELALCSTELSFLHPKSKERLEFSITPSFI